MIGNIITPSTTLFMHSIIFIVVNHIKIHHHMLRSTSYYPSLQTIQFICHSTSLTILRNIQLAWLMLTCNFVSSGFHPFTTSLTTTFIRPLEMQAYAYLWVAWVLNAIRNHYVQLSMDSAWSIAKARKKIVHYDQHIWQSIVSPTCLIRKYHQFVLMVENF